MDEQEQPLVPHCPCPLNRGEAAFSPGPDDGCFDGRSEPPTYHISSKFVGGSLYRTYESAGTTFILI